MIIQLIVICPGKAKGRVKVAPTAGQRHVPCGYRTRTNLHTWDTGDRCRGVTRIEAWTDSLMVQGRQEILHHISQGVMCTSLLRMSEQFSANENVELIMKAMMMIMKGSVIRNPFYGS